MLKNEADKIDRACREKFTYEVKPFNLLHWRSHLDDALAERDWSGPCGDLVSTVMDALTRRAAALEDCYRLLVSIEHQEMPDHVVGCVKTSDSGFVIVGDTTRPGAYSHHAMAHRPIDFNRLSEASGDPVWHAGVPW